jgi:hypothetical protein
VAADVRYLRPDGGKLGTVVSPPLTNCWTEFRVTLPATSIERFRTCQMGRFGLPVALLAVRAPRCWDACVTTARAWETSKPGEALSCDRRESRSFSYDECTDSSAPRHGTCQYSEYVRRHASGGTEWPGAARSSRAA